MRTQIRHKLKELFLGIDVIGDKIFYDHVYGLNEKLFPCITIHTQNQKPEKVGLGRPSVLEQPLNVYVYVLCSARDEYQDFQDEILLQIQHRIASNVNLDGLVREVSIADIDVDIDDSFKPPLASLMINLEINYRTMENSVDVSI